MSSNERDYEPPKQWREERFDGGVYGHVNRAQAGARFEAALPRGDHSLQLYSQGTPNGQKVTIMLEELLFAGESGAEYDAHLIRILDGEQFSSGFTAANPNSKIPLLIDHSGAETIAVFESGSILLHLADRFGRFLPQASPARAATLNWLFWLQGAAPYLGGFGHFYAYAPRQIKYPLDRYTMEAKRILDVLDKQLAKHQYVASNSYSVADIACWPWFAAMYLEGAYGAYDFLDLSSYTHVERWIHFIAARPAVARGRIVNTIKGPAGLQLHERHHAKDIDANLEARGKHQQSHP